MQNVDRYISDMTAQSRSRMTRFRVFWEALDAVLKRRCQPPLTFEQACDWFDCEIEPEDVPDAKRAPWDDHYFEERLTREADQ